MVSDVAVNNSFAGLEGGEVAVPAADGEVTEAPPDETAGAGSAEETPAEGEVPEVAASTEAEPGTTEEVAAQTEGGEEDTSAKTNE